MKAFLFPRFVFLFLFSVIAANLSAQWSLKHASSVIVNDYLPCHSVINNNVYLVGTPDGINNYVYEYDPAANSYTQKTATTIVGFNDQVSFTLNGQMYLVSLGNQNSYAYDPPGDAWLNKDNTHSLGSLLMSLYSPSSYGLVFNGSLFAFVLNNKAYIGGLTVVDLSTNMQSMSPFVFVYDPVADNYSVVTVPNIATSYNVIEPTTFVLNGKGYVMGTENDPMTFSGGPGVFEFDPSGNSFTTKNSCGCGHMAYSSFVLNNVAYVNAVQNCSDKTPVYTFDPVANTWSPSDTIILPDTADLRLGFAVNGKGYFGYGKTYNSLCGITGGNSLLYEYTPTATGISENENFAAHVFPNPASGRLTIELPAAAADDEMLTIFDVPGNEVLRQVIRQGEKEISVDVSALSPGIYFFRAGDGNVRQQVIIGE